MGKAAAAWLAGLSACPLVAHAQAPQVQAPQVQASPVQASQADAPAHAFVARLIAEAKVGGVFADASAGPAPQARHLASGLVCRFAIGRPGSIRLLPGPNPADNVGCTLPRGSGVLALQVQRLGPSVDAARFMVDAVEVVHGDFPDAAPIAAPAADAPGLEARHFKATFQGRPVYVAVLAVRAGPWMVSGHMVAPLKDARAADAAAEAEVRAAAMQIGR